MPTSILKVPEIQYTEEAIRRSVQLVDELEQLAEELPEKKRQHTELGVEVARLKDEVEFLRKSNAFHEDIRAATEELRQAENRQAWILGKHNQEVAEKRDKLEKLTMYLRAKTHERWLDELKGLVALRKIETTEPKTNALTDAVTRDIRTNAAVIAEARDRLIEAIHQLQTLQHSSIPDIMSFIEAFESELKKLDLSRLQAIRKVPSWRVDELQQDKPSGDIATATMTPGGELIMHTPKPDLNGLADRVTKLEKQL